MVTIQFVKTDPEWGQIPCTYQEVLPFHYQFPGKLSRGFNERGYRVWEEDVTDFQLAARKLGYDVVRAL